uniref:Uncharacterized protein n=1 Tax=Vespula pensylvanica TaxID=30213 RepID=A0A834KCG6_VESPE|nr:hypothetical protein H0235_014867 [Vespula pensylvanica]
MSLSRREHRLDISGKYIPLFFRNCKCPSEQLGRSYLSDPVIKTSLSRIVMKKCSKRSPQNSNVSVLAALQLRQSSVGYESDNKVIPNLDVVRVFHCQITPRHCPSPMGNPRNEIKDPESANLLFLVSSSLLRKAALKYFGGLISKVPMLRTVVHTTNGI